VVLDSHQESRKALGVVQDGVKDVDVIRQILENTIYIYADNVLEKLQIH
tara:strand:- start:26 stop:172 length:147 start_codon:yes stop_codon:yes gene_type:complete